MRPAPKTPPAVNTPAGGCYELTPLGRAALAVDAAALRRPRRADAERCAWCGRPIGPDDPALEMASYRLHDGYPAPDCREAFDAFVHFGHADAAESAAWTS